MQPTAAKSLCISLLTIQRVRRLCHQKVPQLDGPAKQAGPGLAQDVVSGFIGLPHMFLSAQISIFDQGISSLLTTIKLDVLISWIETAARPKAASALPCGIA